MSDLQAGGALFDDIWHPHAGTSIINIEVLQALATSDSYIAGAYDRDGTLLGACVGFWGAPTSGTLFSHVAGVSPTARGRHLGYALKLHQRAWALSRGVRRIAWTFDPLVRRNAHFNIEVLGGQCSTYLVDHYGAMLDEINAGDQSDRLLLEWI